MEDISSSVTNSKKRARDEPDFNLHESNRVDSGNSDANSPESKRVREDLLDTLEDADPETQDLDSVIKSFEYEILNQSTGEESQPEFGYLFKASDDELGLPPTMSASERKNSESTDLGPTMPHLGFDDDDITSYDSFGFGIVGETEEWNSEFVTLELHNRVMALISWAKKHLAQIGTHKSTKVEEMVIAADLKCIGCQKRVADLISKMDDAESMEVHVAEKKVTLTGKLQFEEDCCRVL